MHPLRDAMQLAEEELRHVVPGASKVMHAWANHKGEKMTPARLDAYAALLELAQQHATFQPLEMPEARCPPDGELVFAWAAHRLGVPLAKFPECARVQGDLIDLGGTGGPRRCVVYRGPLVLSGAVRVTGTVVVVGDLTIEGSLTDGWATDSALVVIGNETVRAMNAGSDHLVTGDFRAQLLHVVSEETCFHCGGTATAHALISDHWNASENLPFVVTPDDLEGLRARLTPTPAPHVTAEDLVEGVGAGTWRFR